MWVTFENINDEEVMEGLTYVTHNFENGDIEHNGKRIGKCFRIECRDIRKIKENRESYIYIIPESRFLDAPSKCVKLNLKNVDHIYMNGFRIK